MTFDLLIQDGDLVFQGGSLRRIEAEAEAVAQRLRIRLGSLLGEWPLDADFGFDWLGQVLVKAPDPLTLSALLKDAITGTTGVGRLTAFELNLSDDRRLQVTFTALVAQTGQALQGTVTTSTPTGVEQEPAPAFAFAVL